jgi:hypothetical protein
MVIAIALGLAGAAQAGRPLATEDADVLDRGRCEWESFAARESASGNPSTNGWATQVGCGFAAQAQVALGYQRSRSDGVSAAGWILGGKVGLLPRREGSTGVTLAWGLTAEKSAGESMRHEGSTIAVVATRELADGLLGHGNLGWARSERERQSRGTWNLAAEWAAGEGLDLMAEVYGEERAKPWHGAGVRYAIGQRLSVNASYGVHRETPRTTLWTLGFKLEF